MKKSICFLILFFCSACFAYSGGSGTVSSPYQIGTAADWNSLAVTTSDYASNFIVTADINFAGRTIPCTDSGTQFSGVFNGQNHIWSNITLDPTTRQYFGMFSRTAAPSVIKNLNIVNGNVTAIAGGSASSYCALLVGEAAVDSNVFNVNANVNVTFTYGVSASYLGYAGAIIGANHGNIAYCSSSGTVKGKVTVGVGNFGGLIGYQTGISGHTNGVNHCYSTTKVTAIDDTSSVTCYVGGLVGGTNRADVSDYIFNSYYNGTVDFNSAANVFAGGLAGLSKLVVSNCYATGTVKIKEYSLSNTDNGVSGFAGYISAGSVSDCYSNCAVKINSLRGYHGGFVGTAAAGTTIANCYARGSIYDSNAASTALTFYFGGFAGYGSTATLTNCYSALSTYSGSGAYGFYVSGGTLTNCFWDTTTSGITAANTGATGKTDTQMQTQSTFTGYDFIRPSWNMKEGSYPQLYWQPYTYETDLSIVADYLLNENATDSNFVFNRADQTYAKYYGKDATVPAAASLTVGSADANKITFTCRATGLSGNNYTLTLVSATPPKWLRTGNACTLNLGLGAGAKGSVYLKRWIIDPCSDANTLFHTTMYSDANTPKLKAAAACNFSGGGGGDVNTTTSARSVTGHTGVANTALSFNGTSDYINTGQTFQSTFQNSFTISFWCKPNNGRSGNEQDLFSEGTDYVIKGYLTYDGYIAIYYGIAGEDGFDTYFPTRLPSGASTNWTMLTIVVTKVGNTTEINLYEDGKFAGTHIIDNNMSDFIADTTLRFASSNVNSNLLLYSGSLDDVRIYKKALTKKQINAIYYGAGLPGCTNPIKSDLDNDCQVDLLDFARLADAWAGNPPEVDLNHDGKLDFKDLAQFASDWLTCNRNPAEECWQ